ncbi:hypothetical protein HID58_089040 [Brassica napus]|uniref:Uncharacterized protein n=1 Tax=Brassica napus TaxID=3708 RepID=A0ABQ7XXW6_BRANA|nr:hypothetical protein HID58_089040 [Brassica napus]
MAATNLQDENFDDDIEEVFQRSTLDWLNQDDLVAIYDRHATIPLPESLITLGPEPLEEGIFLYFARRIRDRFGWDDVEETRRKNCRSGPPVQGAQKTMVAPTRMLLMRMETLTRRTRMEALTRRLWMEAKKVPPTPMMSMETPIMIRSLMKAKRANLYCHFVSISRLLRVV